MTVFRPESLDVTEAALSSDLHSAAQQGPVTIPGPRQAYQNCELNLRRALRPDMRSDPRRLKFGIQIRATIAVIER